MKTIEVKSCGSCPFIKTDETHDYCGLMPSMDAWLPKDKVHEKCLLKKESVTVKIKEEKDATRK